MIRIEAVDGNGLYKVIFLLNNRFRFNFARFKVEHGYELYPPLGADIYTIDIKRGEIYLDDGGFQREFENYVWDTFWRKGRFLLN